VLYRPVDGTKRLGEVLYVAGEISKKTLTHASRSLGARRPRTALRLGERITSVLLGFVCVPRAV